MSLTIRALEEQLGVRLFNRTTRSVALTEAGEHLLTEVQPILDAVGHALESINAFRDKPMGSLRLSVTRPFATMLLAPHIAPFLAEFPAIRLEVAVDDALSDIVGGRFDAGIRIGGRVERDMTIVRIGAGFRMLTVAAPQYLGRREPPSTPKDLHAHNCILYRAPWDHGIVPWGFERNGLDVEIVVDGSLVVNDPDLWLSAVLDGVGVGYLPETIVAPYLEQGRLISMLDDWSRWHDGVFLYHPSRRQTPAPLTTFIRFIQGRRALLL